ncbi:MAG: TorF family putative porin [gamma proteobacterium symbiont of Taylorina sp.]|nr:TorF family putative porin [gamma proteobacterium symbiont of Taylorina sp.]
MKKTLTSAAVCCSLLSVLHSAQADVSLTVTAVTDYTLNGISQTQSDPALQVGLDWAGENGLYVGAWTSNVDFGENDKTSQEIDVYFGKYWQLTEKIGLTTGLAYYAYDGASYSDDYNYPEALAKFGYNSSLGDSELNFWYTNDYNGLGAGNSVVVLAHKFEVAEGHNVRFIYKHSKSYDVDKFAWGGSNEDSYDHFRAEYTTSWKGIDFNLAVEDTSNLADYYDADERVVLSIAKTFGF